MFHTDARTFIYDVTVYDVVVIISFSNIQPRVDNNFNNKSIVVLNIRNIYPLTVDVESVVIKAVH